MQESERHLQREEWLEEELTCKMLPGVGSGLGEQPGSQVRAGTQIHEPSPGLT